MIYAALALMCVLFIELFILLNLRLRADEIFSVSREAMQTMSSKSLSDAEKEVAIRGCSLRLLKATLLFTGLFGLIVLALVAVYVAFVAMFPDLRGPLDAALLSPLVLAGMTAGALAYIWLRRAITK